MENVLSPFPMFAPRVRDAVAVFFVTFFVAFLRVGIAFSFFESARRYFEFRETHVMHGMRHSSPHSVPSLFPHRSPKHTRTSTPALPPYERRVGKTQCSSYPSPLLS